MKLILLPYKQTSKGAAQVARALALNAVTRDARFNPERPVAVLNWGRGDFPVWRDHVTRFINPPDAVVKAINKVQSFRAFQRAGVPCAPFTTSRREAEGWLRERNRPLAVLCRTELEGKDAAGLVVARELNQIVDAPLYTRYVKKLHEYRVHVMNGECFYVNKKVKKAADAVPRDANPLIRSGSHGWFFHDVEGIPLSAAVQQACVDAVQALGLDFGGVDVGVTAEGTPVIYEVNTAPEMGPNSTRHYKEAFKKHYGNYNNENNVPIRNIA